MNSRGIPSNAPCPIKERLPRPRARSSRVNVLRGMRGEWRRTVVRLHAQVREAHVGAGARCFPVAGVNGRRAHGRRAAKIPGRRAEGANGTGLKQRIAQVGDGARPRGSRGRKAK